jgi:hypothetical protein
VVTTTQPQPALVMMFTPTACAESSTVTLVGLSE